MSKFENGMKVRRAVLGDAHVDRAQANATSFDANFQEYITENVWGTVWSGSGLEIQTRHLITIGILAALGREHELELHLRATINTKLSPEQLREVFLHVAVYAGVPAANTAFALAKRIFKEQGRLEENA